MMGVTLPPERRKGFLSQAGLRPGGTQPGVGMHYLGLPREMLQGLDRLPLFRLSFAGTAAACIPATPQGKWGNQTADRAGPGFLGRVLAQVFASRCRGTDQITELVHGIFPPLFQLWCSPRAFAG